jgi:hypothetical protein
MAESAEEIYVIDSSSWIAIEQHPASNRILYYLSDLVDRGLIRCPVEVWNELKRCPFVKGWIKQRKKQIVHSLRNNGEFHRLVGEVAIRFPSMAGVRSARSLNNADPYVVAYAAYRNRTENPTVCIVVCDETLAMRPNRKIPTACHKFGVKPVSLLEMLANEFPDEDWS